MSTAAKPAAEESEIEVPADWVTEVDRDADVKKALAECGKVSATMSGSAYEKELRSLRRVDFRVYQLGGGLRGDLAKVSTYSGTLTELRSRRDALERQGRPAPELDAAIESMQRNVERLQTRIDAAGGERPDRVTVMADRQSAQEAVDGLQRTLARYWGSRLPPPPGLEERLAAAEKVLDAAEDVDVSTRREFDALGATRQKQMIVTRRALATRLRGAVLPIFGRRVSACFNGDVRSYQRHPERPYPREVEQVIREAKEICILADRLAGDNAGEAPFCAALAEPIRDLIFPMVSSSFRRKEKGAPADGLLDLKV